MWWWGGERAKIVATYLRTTPNLIRRVFRESPLVMCQHQQLYRPWLLKILRFGEWVSTVDGDFRVAGAKTWMSNLIDDLAGEEIFSVTEWEKTGTTTHDNFGLMFMWMRARALVCMTICVCVSVWVWCPTKGCATRKSYTTNMIIGSNHWLHTIFHKPLFPYIRILSGSSSTNQQRDSFPFVFLSPETLEILSIRFQTHEIKLLRVFLLILCILHFASPRYYTNRHVLFSIRLFDSHSRADNESHTALTGWVHVRNGLCSFWFQSMRSLSPLRSFHAESEWKHLCVHGLCHRHCCCLLCCFVICNFSFR